jgi:hypothetical protein
MSFQVRCGKRMDGSGPSRVSSSPNYERVELISRGLAQPLFGDDRLPLPAGHPLSWALLTLGTLLEGSVYADSL